MMQTTQPELFMNMQQFSDLKLAVRKDSEQAGKAVAQQFEGLFIQMMLKEMRSAAVMDESQHSSYMDFYTDMYDKQISLMLSQQGGIGIADMMMKQIQQHLPQGQKAAAEDGKILPVYRLPESQVSTQVNKLDNGHVNEPVNEQVHQLPMPVMNYVAINPAVKAHEFSQTLASEVTVEATANDSKDVENQNPALFSQTLEPFYGWQQAESFVKDLWPHAEKAAQQLGVSTDVLVAQSALETGWGKHAMKKSDGSVAYNLFGIKAGSSWAGQSVTHNTLEFRQGSMQKESANFRAYDSVADALEDYVSFIQTRSRYAQALNHSGSDSHYVKGLQKAGYATDPAYARKISNIMQGQTFNDALASMAKHKVALS